MKFLFAFLATIVGIGSLSGPAKADKTWDAICGVNDAYGCIQSIVTAGGSGAYQCVRTAFCNVANKKTLAQILIDCGINLLPGSSCVALIGAAAPIVITTVQTVYNDPLGVGNDGMGKCVGMPRDGFCQSGDTGQECCCRAWAKNWCYSISDTNPNCQSSMQTACNAQKPVVVTPPQPRPAPAPGAPVPTVQTATPQ